MSPGAHKKRPGSVTLRNDDNASERAVALVQQALDLMRLAENAPASPVTAFLTRSGAAHSADAARLRQGKTEPRYNLHNAAELADLYERTVQRDELFERSVRDFQRIARDLGRIREEHPSALPGGEAARRYRNVLRLA